MAGTITQTRKKAKKANTMTLTFACTADAADGSFPATAFDTAFMAEAARHGGWVYSVETWPGATTPTNDSDLTITNENSLDILGGNGANQIHSSNKKWFLPKNTDGGYAYYPVTEDTTLTLNITNNAVNSAIVNIRVTFTLKEYVK